jgi:hypothetical protein
MSKDGVPDDGVFRRVIGYFLGHEKPSKEKAKPKRRSPRKKPSNKANKRA